MRRFVSAWVCSVAAAANVHADVQGVVLPASAMVTPAHQALRDSLAWLPVTPVLKLLRTPDAMRLPVQGRVAIDAEAEPVAAGRIASVMRVRVNVSVDGRVLRTLPLLFQVSASGTGPVAAHGLRAGHVIAEADVQTGEVDLAAFDHAQPLAARTLVGQRLKQDLKPLQAFMPRWIEAMPQVARGERVAVELVRDGIVLEAPGVAMADGRTGERTRVRLWRDEIVDATVVGANLVRLQERTHP